MIRLCTFVSLLLGVAYIWYAEPASSAEGDRFLCTLSNGKKSFQQKPDVRCSKNVLEKGWVNLIFEDKILVDYHPDSVLRDNDGVKVWLQFFMATPLQSTNGRWKYDYVKAAYRFLCKTQQQLLIQGTYRLGEITTYERSPNESILEEIEPDTISDWLQGFFCKNVLNDPAIPKLPENEEAIAQLSEAQFRLQFRCPEFFSTADERNKELWKFMQWIRAHAVGWTVGDVARFRMSLLETHKCMETLRNIRENGRLAE